MKIFDFFMMVASISHLLMAMNPYTMSSGRCMHRMFIEPCTEAMMTVSRKTINHAVFKKLVPWSITIPSRMYRRVLVRILDKTQFLYRVDC